MKKIAFACIVMACPVAIWAAPEQAAVPVRTWTVYLVQHTHTDIGYTRPQSEMLAEHLRFIDTALDYCDLTDGYPEDAKFRWTCETSWPVREYLARRPSSQVERLKRRVQEGRIEITGMFLNMSEIASEASLSASLQPLRQFKDAEMPVKLAMQNDVNGAAWCLIDYLQPVGVRYLTMGINRTRSLLPFDIPTAFWWESPSGKRILAFRSDHYHMGNLFKIHECTIEPFRTKLLEYLHKLESRQYLYDRIVVPFSGYHIDNSPPAMGECELVRLWNAQPGTNVRLRMATASEFMDYVADHHAGELPVYRAAWPDWWTDGFGSAARETKASRETHANMLATQGLLAMAAILDRHLSRDVNVPRRAMAVQDQATFYDEHTFGASSSVRDPSGDSSMVQWGQKGSYAWEASKQASLLREEALGLLEPVVKRVSGQPTLVVFNTLNWARSGLAEVFIDHEMLGKSVAGEFIDSDTQELVPAQLLRDSAEGSRWAIWTKNVPALGYRTYLIRKGQTLQAATSRPDISAGVIENEWYRLTMSPETGAVASLLDKDSGRELVDPQARWGLGQFIYERLSSGNREAFERKALARSSVRNVRIEAGAGGPIWRSLVSHADLDGAQAGSACVECRLFSTEKRVELRLGLRKLPIAEPEAVYVAFPFAWSDGKLAYEAQGGLVSPGKNQLERSASDWQTVQSFAAVRSSAGQIVWSSLGAPLVQFGDLNCGKWQPMLQADKPYIFSWPMNNYWFTNFKATQQGELNWSYDLTSGDDASNSSATRFAWGSQVPLVARAFPPVQTAEQSATVHPSFPLVRCEPVNLLLVEARPAWHSHGVILHWRELDGKSAILNLADQPFANRVTSVDEVDVVEETLAANCRTLSFSPYEVKLVRLNLEKQ